MIQQNNNNNNNNNKPNNNHQLRDRKPFNDFLATNLDATIENRYCTKCHIKLVHNPRNSPHDLYIYSCPQCNCGPVNIHNTEPGERLVTTFPTHNTLSGGISGSNKKSVTQPDSQRLSRSQYFINKRLEEKNKIEIQDPYLAILKNNNKIRITNIDYTSPEDYEDE